MLSKKKRKLFVVLVTLLSIFLATTVQAENRMTLLEQQKGLGENEEVSVKVMEDTEIKMVSFAEHNLPEAVQLKQDLKDNGFVLDDVEKEDSKLKYTVKTPEGNLTSYIKSSVFKHEETGEIVITHTIFDREYGKITNFVAQKYNSNNKDGELEVIAEYNDIIEFPDDEFTTHKSFKWNGKTFRCSLAGVFACTHTCGIWAIVNPGAGIACSLVCGAVFAAAC